MKTSVYQMVNIPLSESMALRAAPAKDPDKNVATAQDDDEYRLMLR